MPDSDRLDRIAFPPFDLGARLDDLVRWLADPDVRRWYDEGDPTRENLAVRFAPEPGTDRYTIEIDGQPVGYIQTYVQRDHPDYLRQVDVDPDAVAMDLFIGDPAYRNRGWGREVIRAFLDQIVFGAMNADLAMIAPNPENARAVRAYANAGFGPVKTIYVVDDDPGNTGNELVMLLSRYENGRPVAGADREGEGVPG